MVQDVGMCSEGSWFQLHHKAGFYERQRQRGQGSKEETIDGRKSGNYVLMFHNCDSDSLSQEVS